MIEAVAASPGLIPAPFEPDLHGACVPCTAWSVPQLLAHMSALQALRDPFERSAWLREASAACAQLLSVRAQLVQAIDSRRRIARLVCVAAGRRGAGPIRSRAELDMLRVAASMQNCVEAVGAGWQQACRRFTHELMLLPTQIDPRATLPGGIEPDVLRLQVADARHTRVRDGDRLGNMMLRHQLAHRRCLARGAAATLARERRQSLDFAVSLKDLDGLHALSVALLDEFLARQALLQAQADRAGAQWELDLLLQAAGR